MKNHIVCQTEKSITAKHIDTMIKKCRLKQDNRKDSPGGKVASLRIEWDQETRKNNSRSYFFNGTWQEMKLARCIRSGTCKWKSEINLEDGIIIMPDKINTFSLPPMAAVCSIACNVVKHHKMRTGISEFQWNSIGASVWRRWMQQSCSHRGSGSKKRSHAYV